MGIMTSTLMEVVVNTITVYAPLSLFPTTYLLDLGVMGYGVATAFSIPGFLCRYLQLKMASTEIKEHEQRYTQIRALLPQGRHEPGQLGIVNNPEEGSLGIIDLQGKLSIPNKENRE